MAWEKLGMIFDWRQHGLNWIKTHAMLPTPLVLDDRIRIYYSPREESGKSRITFIDVDINDPRNILHVHEEPILAPGKLGTCDDSGSLCTCAVKNGDEIYLYYTAYNIKVTVPYGNAIGIAISKDGGTTFERPFDGPLLDRGPHDPYFVISPWVIKNKGKWHMWYASGTKWVLVDGKPESLYKIKYASSDDGINWTRNNDSCIEPLSEYEANARPTVIWENDAYKMWFCYRGSHEFRDGPESYRIGYATAANETDWVRNDAEAAISPGPDEWDSKMQAYPAIAEAGEKRYMFYNGNGFGFDGFCCAVWK